MTTNIYEQLCDEVGAIGPNESCPVPSAEQRERLEELILNQLPESFGLNILKAGGKYSLVFTKKDIYTLVYKIESWPSVIFTIAENRPDALYALTYKLIQEGVLDKEEVKEALCKL